MRRGLSISQPVVSNLSALHRCLFSNMKLLAVFAVCFAVATATDPWAEIPDCAAAKAANFVVPNCPAIGPCLVEVHLKAKDCVRLESEDADASACTTQDEVKGARINWLKASCKSHAAAVKCMGGESTEGFVSRVFRYKRAAHNEPTPEEIAKIAAKAYGRCWLDVRAKLHQCKALGETCENFATCTGHNAAAEPWGPIAKNLHDRKEAAMHNYKDKMKTCLNARTQPAVFL